MRWRWTRPRTLPPRDADEPLRDGDTVPYPGFPRAADVIAPTWAAGPTEPLPEVDRADLVRPYTRRRPSPRPAK